MQLGSSDPVGERTAEQRSLVQQLVDRQGDQAPGDGISGPERVQPVSDLPVITRLYGIAPLIYSPAYNNIIVRRYPERRLASG